MAQQLVSAIGVMVDSIESPQGLQVDRVAAATATSRASSTSSTASTVTRPPPTVAADQLCPELTLGCTLPDKARRR